MDTKKKIKLPKSVRNFLILIVIAFFIKTSILEIYVVPTGSMLDTIEVNDAIIGNKFIYGLRTPNWLGVPYTRNGFYIPSHRFPAFKEVNNGDIAIFEFPNDDNVKYVKRTIGLPGQFVEIRDGEIYIGESKENLKYREDLTYPPESKFTKQKKKSESISENKKYTEKTSMSMIAGDRAPFSYYKPIKSNQKEEVINLDNMSLQVPYKGMEIDIMDSENDFYSTLMILLLDGNKIELQDFESGEHSINKKQKYTFHKYDYDSMAKTSVTIKNWFTGLGKSKVALPLMFLVIIYTAYMILDTKKKYSNRKKISQAIFCIILSVLILVVSNRDIVNYNEAESIAQENIDDDLGNGLIPLSWFFQDALKNDEIVLNTDYNPFLINPRALCEIEVRRKNGDMENLNDEEIALLFMYLEGLNKKEGQSFLGSKSKYLELAAGDLRLKGYIQTENECLEKYYKEEEFRYEFLTVADNYFKKKTTQIYYQNQHYGEALKALLKDKILINGKTIDKQSKFTLNHNYYFMVGDNHNNSADSRSWGFVPDYNLLGQPVITLVNFEKFKFKFDIHL